MNQREAQALLRAYEDYPTRNGSPRVEPVLRRETAARLIPHLPFLANAKEVYWPAVDPCQWLGRESASLSNALTRDLLLGTIASYQAGEIQRALNLALTQAEGVSETTRRRLERAYARVCRYRDALRPQPDDDQVPATPALNRARASVLMPRGVGYSTDEPQPEQALPRFEPCCVARVLTTDEIGIVRRQLSSLEAQSLLDDAERVQSLIAAGDPVAACWAPMYLPWLQIDVDEPVYKISIRGRLSATYHNASALARVA